MTNALARYLATCGITQRQFASDMGVREATVSAWVNGGTPRPEQMQRIAAETRNAVPVTSWFSAAQAETGTAA